MLVRHLILHYKAESLAKHSATKTGRAIFGQKFVFSPVLYKKSENVGALVGLCQKTKKIYIYIYMFMSGGGNCYPNSCRSRFSGVHLVFEVFQMPVAPTRKMLVYTGMLPCLVPSWPQIMQIRISFRSRSNLALDADNALDFSPISFYRRVSRFVAFQTKVEHLCFCLVRTKVPLLIYIYIYIYKLWSYYLGHVWGFLIVTNWATFVFLKRLFVKKQH